MFLPFIPPQHENHWFILCILLLELSIMSPEFLTIVYNEICSLHIRQIVAFLNTPRRKWR